ncbi:MAG: hypothetical protein AAFO07_28765 [Bacteroidota bacterium]
MRNSGMKWLMILVLALAINVTAFANDPGKRKRPPKPDRIEEVITEQPSRYHEWRRGKWKWNKKAQEWTWREGFWRELSPNEIARRYGYNDFRFNGFWGGGFHPFWFNRSRLFFRPIFLVY